MNISDQLFTIFDTETTGMSPHEGARLMEIGAVHVRGTTILHAETFESFIQPGHPIPFECTKISGITDEDVKDAPSLFEVIPAFMDFVGESVLVAQNAEFDKAFLDDALFQSNPFAQPTQIFCTKLLSRSLYPKEKFHNLDTMSYRLGLPPLKEGRHRALADVLLTAEIFIRLLQEAKVQTVEELWKLQ